jgi:hypothetical protein
MLTVPDKEPVSAATSGNVAKASRQARRAERIIQYTLPPVISVGSSML